MENQITLNVPSRKGNQVEFKGYKLYTEDGKSDSNGLWLANISFTPETESAGCDKTLIISYPVNAVMP